LGTFHAALTGACELVTGRATGFSRLRSGVPDLAIAALILLAVIAAAMLLPALAAGDNPVAALRGFQGIAVLVAAELAVCLVLAMASGCTANWPVFAVALLWCWSLVLGVVALLLVPLETIHRAGGDATGARSGTLLLGGGFFVLVGLYAIWLNWFLLRRGLGLGRGGAVLGVVLMFVTLSVVSTLQADFTPVTLQGLGG